MKYGAKMSHPLGAPRNERDFVMTGNRALLNRVYYLQNDFDDSIDKGRSGTNTAELGHQKSNRTALVGGTSQINDSYRNRSPDQKKGHTGTTTVQDFDADYQESTPHAGHIKIDQHDNKAV
jgi:hypothetical protein